MTTYEDDMTRDEEITEYRVQIESIEAQIQTIRANRDALREAIEYGVSIEWDETRLAEIESTILQNATLRKELSNKIKELSI